LSAQLFLEVTAKSVEGSWASFLPPHVGKAILSFP